MRCPSCKEPVSQFAAGCSICGADLAAARRAQADRRAKFDRLPSLPRLGENADWLLLGVCVLLVLFFPITGILLAGYGIYRNSLSSQRPLRIALGVVILAGLVFLVDPATQYGVITRL